MRCHQISTPHLVRHLLEIVIPGSAKARFVSGHSNLGHFSRSVRFHRVNWMTEDLIAMEREAKLFSKTRHKTGIAVALPDGYEAQIRPRSGLALKNGVTLLNTPGTIDADYRGEIGLIVINHGEEPFIVTRGMRLAQMVVQRVCRVDWEETETLAKTVRGSGGFGHT